MQKSQGQIGNKSQGNLQQAGKGGAYGNVY